MSKESTMRQKEREVLYSDFNSICTKYVDFFCEKHGIPYPDPVYWVGDRVGETIELGDRFYDFNDIRYDVDNGLPEGEIEEWWDYCYDLAMLECPKTINLDAWHRGAPRPYTQAQLDAIRQAHNDVVTAKQVLEDLLNG